MYEDVIERALADGDKLGPLYAELMPKGLPVAPGAAVAIAEIFSAIGRAEEADSFLLFLLDLATHEGGELILPSLRRYAGRIEEFSRSDDSFTAQLAVSLLGYCGPDADLAGRLRDRAAGGDKQVCHLLIAVARLQKGEAVAWLSGFLALPHFPGVRVSAVAAMRLAGSPALPGLDDVVVSAWEQDPDLDAPAGDGARLPDLAGYLGPQVLARLGRSASPGARREVAQALGRVAMPDQNLLRSLLIDPDGDVRKRAWHTLCRHEELARQNTDVLARAISDRHPARFAAANALARLGDRRALGIAAEAIRKGKAGKQMLRALADEDAPIDAAVRDAATDRMAELDELVGKPGHGLRPITELAGLARILKRAP